MSFIYRHCERPKGAWRSSLLWIAASLSLLAMTFFYLPASAQDAAKPPVYVLTMDGAIGPAFSGYLDAGLAKAQADKAQLLVIELDTPGGLLSSTRDMATSIVESRIPVAVWVTPSGAHAASAGTFILYAAHIAAMDEGTNVGAATPIEMKGQLDEPIRGKDGREKPATGAQDDEQSLRKMLEDMGDPNAKAMRQKAIEDTAAFIRGLAELRGRNAEWAEKAVTEAASITAAEALEINVIDLIALNRAELLEKVNGKVIPIKNGEPVTLDTAGAPVTEFKPDWKTKLLSMITDPNIALILMSIGVYGLILEFYNPGSLVPGTIGAICLILGLYAMNVLPINAAGVALMILGVVFIIAEAFMPSFGILGLGGLAAFIVGATIMFDAESMPGLALDWGVIWGIAFCGLLVVGLTAFLAARVYKKQVTTGPESMTGKKAEVVEWKKTEGRVRIQGEIWNAYADETLDLKKDDEVLVSKVEGLDLKVRAIE